MSVAGPFILGTDVVVSADCSRLASGSFFTHLLIIFRLLNFLHNRCGGCSGAIQGKVGKARFPCSSA